MQIDAVAADSDGICERLGRMLFPALAGKLHTRVGADMLLQDGEFGLNTPGLANIRILREPILRSHYVAPQAQPAPPSGRGGSVCIQ